MDIGYIIITIIGTIGSLLGIISFFINWKTLIRKVKNFILVKILNRKPMLFDLRLVNKYNKEPIGSLNFKLYQEINHHFNRRTESISKKALRPESMKILIKKLSSRTNFELIIRIDEEEKLDFLTLDDAKILHYNLILKLSHPVNLNWYDLKNLKDLIRYIEQIEIIIKNGIFKSYDLNQRFFSCYIERQFFIKDKPFFKEDDLRNVKVRIEKDKINITGSDLGTLEDTIDKYFLK